MNKGITEKDLAKIKATPGEKKVVLLYELTAAVDMLVASINRDFRRMGYQFDREKKMMFGRYTDSVRKAAHWYEQIGIDETIWNAIGRTFNGYDNYMADTNEMLRFLMIYIDRTQTEEGFQSLYRYLSNMPKSGVFPDEVVAEFNFDRPYEFGVGDRVGTKFGEGVLVGRGNDGYWVVQLGDEQKIIHENKITLL